MMYYNPRIIKYPTIGETGIPSQEDLLKIRDKVIMENKKPAKYKPALFFGIDFPYNNALNNTFMNNSTVYPLKTMKFEDMECLVPNDPDAYLRNLYNDYIKFPR